MLGADVEAEPDSSASRALRAARATVRLELPPNFGRPGSAVPAGHPPPATTSTYSGGFGSSPPPSIQHASVAPGLASEVPWMENPRTRRLLGMALAALVLVFVALFSLRSRPGSLVVTALAPGNLAVDDVTIFIDGKPLCDVSPCRIKGLTAGVHTLRASAPNLASQAEETVEISSGEEATYNIDLLAVAPEIRAGGLRIPAGDAPLTLYVDGKRVGKLPQEVAGLASGKHWIKLDPEDGGTIIEKAVTIQAGETIEVEPKAAKRDKALVTIRLSPGSEGALVTFDDAFLLDFPAELELDPNSIHTLSATKPGYEVLSLEVKLAPGETEKLIDVSLEPGDSSSAPRKNRPKAVRKPPAAAASKAAPTAPAAQLADATQGLLNISSVPPSQIILNGRPLGSTPKTGISVPGDSLQTIVFVHPKMGRRRAQKFVPAGKERTVSIRF
jgi:serine/threonine-protein kinase